MTGIGEQLGFEPKKTYAQCKTLLHRGYVTKYSVNNTQHRNLNVPALIHNRFVSQNEAAKAAKSVKVKTEDGEDAASAEADEDEDNDDENAANEGGAGASDEDVEQMKLWVADPVAREDDEVHGPFVDGESSSSGPYYTYEILPEADRKHIISSAKDVLNLRLIKLLSKVPDGLVERRMLILRLVRLFAGSCFICSVIAHSILSRCCLQGWPRVNKYLSATLGRIITAAERRDLIRSVVVNDNLVCLQITERGREAIPSMEAELLIPDKNGGANSVSVCAAHLY